MAGLSPTLVAEIGRVSPVRHLLAHGDPWHAARLSDDERRMIRDPVFKPHPSIGKLVYRARYKASLGRKMNFSAVVKSLGLTAIGSFETRPCPDQYIGRISEIETAGGILTREPASRRPAENCLVLVLESPHIHEFTGEPGPAKGTTGEYIAAFLRQVPGIQATDHRPVILVNAIQYQCSLGQPTARYRDRVFTAAWRDGGRTNFMRRLDFVYRSGDTVVCCCTKGNAKDRANQLRQLVYEAIKEAVPRALVLRRTHPVGWNIGRNRLYEWDPV